MQRSINIKGSRGFSMMEILVTFTVSAIGLMGVSGTQVLSLKNINNTNYRSMATLYAYDMAERMHSNPNGVDGGAYNAIDGSETNPGCSVCTINQLAQQDAYSWNAAIKQPTQSGGLPNGLGTVTAVAGSPGLFNISIRWDEQVKNSAGGSVQAQSFTLGVQF